MKYIRSVNYREEFIRKHPGYKGIYMCAYCGRIMRKETMQVDHVISINRANVNFLYRPLLHGKDINTVGNMVASCPKCNLSKSDKGGLWIIRGKLGPYIFPLIWVATLFVFFSVIFMVFVTHSITGESIRSFFAETIAWLPNRISIISHNILSQANFFAL